MLVSEIIYSALRKIGAVASGETATTSELSDSLEAFQVMLRSWAADSLVVFSSVHETHTLVSGTGSYTMGSSGDIDTIRPNTVTGMSIVDSLDITHEVFIISEAEYRKIGLKTSSERPSFVYVQYEYPLVTLNLYPVPNKAETLNIESLKPFTETSSFAATSDTLQMPVYYDEPAIFNLAVRLAPEFGKTISAEVGGIASASYKRLTTRNIGNHIEPVHISLPVRARGSYNINTW